MLNPAIGNQQHFRRLVVFVLAALGGAAIFLGFQATAQSPVRKNLSALQEVPNAGSNAYRQTNLVSDVPGLGQILDPSLVNPWGITQSATSPFWVSNNGTGTATLY